MDASAPVDLAGQENQLPQRATNHTRRSRAGPAPQVTRRFADQADCGPDRPGHRRTYEIRRRQASGPNETAEGPRSLPRPGTGSYSRLRQKAEIENGPLNADSRRALRHQGKAWNLLPTHPDRNL